MSGVSDGFKTPGRDVAPLREDIAYGPLPRNLGHLRRRAPARVFADVADSLGEAVSPAEFGLLTLVAENPGITQVRLAAALSLGKST